MKASGITLFVTARNLEKATNALGDILDNDQVHLLQLDLASLDSVRSFVEQFKSKSKSLNILIENAGIRHVPKGKTEDDFELHWGTNHLAHFLLFELLKPMLLESSTTKFQSRVVLVSSTAHRNAPMDFSDLNWEKRRYAPSIAYGQSKLANVYTASEIERRYGSQGLHAWSVHPGGIRTGLQKPSFHDALTVLKCGIMTTLKSMMSPEQGASTTVWAAISRDLEGQGGKYLERNRISQQVEKGFGLIDPGHAEWAYEEESAKRLAINQYARHRLFKSVLFRTRQRMIPASNGRSGDDKLAALPDELLVRIFEAVGQQSKHDLCGVSRLNHHYHALADAVLYKTVHFLTPELHLLFGESLKRRPRRGSAIHGIKLTYPASELPSLLSDAHLHPSSRRIDTVSQTISTMSNLEVLDIEVPDVLLHGMGHIFNGPFDLACLKECTLFYSNDNGEYWDLQENIHVFAHPTLEVLIIKRAKLDDKGFDLIERPHETALSVLHLVECDINDDALSDLLMFPRALKEFVMTQTEQPTPELEDSSDNIRDYIMALSPANHSLESITIDFPTLLGLRALSLRDFAVLKTFRINWDYQLFGMSSKKKPRMHSVGLPPQLEVLEFFNELGTDEEVTDLLVYMIQGLHISARNLKRLILVAGEDGVPKDVIEACKAQAQLELNIIGEMDGVD
ncbi:hypothetical protein G7Z17_g5994 [Cylindrodendrum hubeiense]|uniref:F-box domain-containing protein n=1 Tax=Cylindrodendrum hubeiense TaxID=595255 RepID=A0A9P5HAS8_9HYPO|nr:hypothetical protein G7Z17_g5994 [Cylindrodendrum hubeiense]